MSSRSEPVGPNPTTEALLDFLFGVGGMYLALAERLRALSMESPPPPDPVALAERILRGRRRRDELFEPDIFGEPVWDMLLDLFVAQSKGHTISVSSLCIASTVPATTALRYISLLVAQGVIDRFPDKRDGRRTLVSLTPRTQELMQELLSDASHPPARARTGGIVGQPERTA